MTDAECKQVVLSRMRPAIEAGTLAEELERLKVEGLINHWTVQGTDILAVFPAPKSQVIRFEVTT